MIILHIFHFMLLLQIAVGGMFVVILILGGNNKRANILKDNIILDMVMSRLPIGNDPI